MTVNTRMGS